MEEVSYVFLMKAPFVKMRVDHFLIHLKEFHHQAYKFGSR